MNRRTLLKTAATLPLGAALSTRAASTPPEFAVTDEQPFSAQTRRLKVTANGRLLTALLFSTEYPTHFRLKPELYPLTTPAGFPVTGTHNYCFIHHQSIMCGHGKVLLEGRDKPLDFYRKLNFPEEARSDRWHRGFNLFHKGPSGIQAITEATWETAATGELHIDLRLEWRERLFNSEEPGPAALIEKRQYRISQKAGATIVDHFSHLAPASTPATLQADTHSFCGVRVNDLIDVEDGGTMRDSEGRENPSGHYWDADGERKAPRWVDCSGEIGGNPVGMTLMGHPKNIRNEYYYREFGLMEVSPTLGHDVPLTADTPLRFATRYLAHDGPLDLTRTENFLTDFAKTQFPF